MQISANQKSRKYRAACVAALVTCFVVACDSVTVSDNDVTAGPAQYTGTLQPAVFTRRNATRLISRVFGSKPYVMTQFDGFSRAKDAFADLSDNPEIAQIPERLSRSLRGIITPAIVDIALRGGPGARISTNETIPCDAGSIEVTGVLEDDGSGAYRFEYRYCTLGSTTVHGRINLEIKQFDWSNLVLTDADYHFSDLNLSAPNFNVDTEGRMNSLVDLSANTEYLTIGEFISVNNLIGEMTMLSNSLKTLVFDDVITPSYSTETHTGRLFDSANGYVDFVTLAPLTYLSVDAIYPASGQVMLRGGTTTIRATMMPRQRVRLLLDLDGDGRFEMFTVLHWSAILLELELIDSDLDGMHDRWETIYGFDPLDAADAAADPDNDGYRNVVEYLGGSNPLSFFSTP